MFSYFTENTKEIECRTKGFFCSTELFDRIQQLLIARNANAVQTASLKKLVRCSNKLIIARILFFFLY